MLKATRSVAAAVAAAAILVCSFTLPKASTTTDSAALCHGPEPHAAPQALAALENAMAWEAVEPQRGTYDRAAADGPVDFAEKNGQPVRHLCIQYGAPHDIAENMLRSDRPGLETAITEADVRMPLPADSTKLEAQAEGYAVLLRACLLTPRCDAFTVWGFSDTYSRVPYTFPGEGAANTLDENNTAEPAYGTPRQTLTPAAGGTETHTC